VTELKPNKKKLGSTTNWLVCPSCGHRETHGADETSPHIIPVVKGHEMKTLEDESNGYYH
jgi:hypothetical protein